MDCVCLRASDVKASTAWYQEKLEFEIKIQMGDGLTIFDLGGATRLAVYNFEPGEAPPVKGHAVTFPVFYSPDAVATHALLVSRGVECGTVTSDGGSTFFSFFDPDGNRLDCCQF